MFELYTTQQVCQRILLAVGGTALPTTRGRLTTFVGFPFWNVVTAHTIPWTTPIEVNISLVGNLCRFCQFRVNFGKKSVNLGLCFFLLFRFSFLPPLAVIGTGLPVGVIIRANWLVINLIRFTPVVAVVVEPAILPTRMLFGLTFRGDEGERDVVTFGQLTSLLQRIRSGGQQVGNALYSNLTRTILLFLGFSLLTLTSFLKKFIDFVCRQQFGKSLAFLFTIREVILFPH